MREMFISLNLTEEEHKFLNAVAVLNDTNAERAANQIIVRFLDDLIADCENTPICQLILPGPPAEDGERIRERDDCRSCGDREAREDEQRRIY